MREFDKHGTMEPEIFFAHISKTTNELLQSATNLHSDKTYLSAVKSWADELAIQCTANPPKNANDK